MNNIDNKNNIEEILTMAKEDGRLGYAYTDNSIINKANRILSYMKFQMYFGRQREEIAAHIEEDKLSELNEYLNALINLRVLVYKDCLYWMKDWIDLNTYYCI